MWRLYLIVLALFFVFVAMTVFLTSGWPPGEVL